LVIGVGEAGVEPLTTIGSAPARCTMNPLSTVWPVRLMAWKVISLSAISTIMND
jgi:hypothetical protein